MNHSELTVCFDQALSQKAAEKAALTDMLASLRQDLATAHMEKEHLQRASLLKQEQGEV